MASILIYTSPARGHLFPALGIAAELHARGHRVCVVGLSGETDRIESLGLVSRPIDPRVEGREMDDWRGKNPLRALTLAMHTFADRAAGEIDDLREAIATFQPDLLLVDTNSWGAQAVAESSGLPWATFQPYFSALPAPGVPPFGPGFRRSAGLAGRIRDRLAGGMIFSRMAAAGLPGLNAARTRIGLSPIASIPELLARPPLVLYLTAREFEYPRTSWPHSYRFVGPVNWAPPTERPPWLNGIPDPVALVTCSSERQQDVAIIQTALRGLPAAGIFVVATTAAYDPVAIENPFPDRSRVERFVPHDHVLARAAVAVCHGGMGITQRALSRGVPVVVVPYGRDQLEVARRVEHAGVGVAIQPSRLNPRSLAAAVECARGMAAKARRLARSFADATEASTVGGAAAAAAYLEELLASQSGAAGPGAAGPGVTGSVGFVAADSAVVASESPADGNIPSRILR